MASAGGTDPVETMAVADVWVHHARRGNVRAQANIGCCFSNGWAVTNGVAIAITGNNFLGVARDVANAAQWRRKAALLGGGDGQAMLGATYPLGAGAEPDPVTVLVISACRLRRWVVDRFHDSVRNGCTPEQRPEAERRACLPIGAEELSP